MTPLSDTEIAARVATASRLRDPRGSGLMFHGTAEPFAGAPEAVGIDGMLWHADDPLFAQAYIPVAGLEALVAKPSDWRLDERVRPDQTSFWADFAVKTMGRPLPDVEYDAMGCARSWSLPAGWPTYRECLDRLRRMGYAFMDGYERVKYADGPDGPVSPASWRLSGRVYVTAAEGLRLLDLHRGESDLTEKAHLDFATFRAAEKAGFDGVVIDDFAQFDDAGNVGHRAVGLFPAAVGRLEYLQYRAVHADFRGGRTPITPEFDSFAASLEAPQPARPALRAV